MSSVPHQPRPHDILPLTGARALAALWVFVYHYGMQGGAPPLGANVWVGYGFQGVDFFFLLSGFILCHVYEAGETRLTWRGYLSFLWFRVARIYPNHLVCTLAILGLAGIRAHPERFNWANFWPQALMVHDWPFFYTEFWNPVSWSISAEWFAYLAIFPIAWWILRRSLPVWLLVALICVLMGGLLAFVLRVVPANRFALDLPRVGLEFLAGALTWRIFKAGGRLVAFGHVALMPLLCLLALASFILPARIVADAMILSLPLIILGLTGETNFPSRFLATAPLLWLGRVSYAFYLVHLLAAGLFLRSFPAASFTSTSWLGRLAQPCAQLLFALLAAAALYYFVEVPVRNLLRRLQRHWVRH